ARLLLHRRPPVAHRRGSAAAVNTGGRWWPHVTADGARKRPAASSARWQRRALQPVPTGCSGADALEVPTAGSPRQPPPSSGGSNRAALESSASCAGWLRVGSARTAPLRQVCSTGRFGERSAGRGSARLGAQLIAIPCAPVRTPLAGAARALGRTGAPSARLAIFSPQRTNGFGWPGGVRVRKQPGVDLLPT